MVYVTDTVDERPAGAALSGFGNLSATLLAISADGGQIDGRNVGDVTATAVVASTTWKAWLVSEDGDGTFTITHSADDAYASEALALVGIADLEVPTGGTALFAGTVDTSTAANQFDFTVAGRLPEVTSGPN